MRFIKILLYLFFIFLVFENRGQIEAQNSTKSTEAEVDSLNKLAWKMRTSSAETSLRYGKEALSKALSINYSKGLIKGYSFTGIAFRNQGKYDKALKQFFEALQLAEKYQFLEDIAYSQINIANIYYLESKPEMAKKYLGYALNTTQSLNKDDIYAYIYLNYARLFRKEENYEKAIEYTDKVLKIRKKQDRPQSIMAVYSEKGKILRDQGNYPDAAEALNEALYIALSHDYRLDIISIYHHLSRTFLYAKNYPQAKHYARMSTMLHPEIANIHLRQNNYDILYQIYKIQKNYEKAIEYHELWTDVQDSIRDMMHDKLLSEMRIRYDTEKKEQENQFLRQENERQSITALAIGGFALLLLGLVYLLLGNNRQKKKANQKLETQQGIILKSHRELKRKNQALEEKQEEIQHQSEVLTQANEKIQRQNFDITSSINYAKRIQQAVLPKLGMIQKYLPNSFVLYQPRDIVSGDLYFFDARENYQVISAIDCTGHGVPGAFMSLIANDLLSNILLLQKENPSPDKILNQLHQNIKTTLRQDENNGQDGMDMSLCIVFPEQQKVEFAGAKNPVFYIQNKESYLIKGDIIPIGGQRRSKIEQYTKHTISISQQTAFYLYSDGFQDQFGGKKGKKFMSRKFRNLLLSIHEMPFYEQKNHLEKTLEDWTEKGKYDQLDDILVLGFQVG